MATMHAMSSVVMALVLSGGFSPLVSAQPTDGTSPTHGSSPPRYEEPPPLAKPGSSQESNSGSTTQIHGQSAGSAQPMTSTTEPPTRAPQGEEATPPDPSPSDNRIQIQNDRGIRYISGGVGEDERAELKAISNQFNLQLLFAMQGGGAYLADVKVTIVDHRGETILAAESNGPWFYAQLPPGSYTVNANTPHQSEQQKVTIDAGQSRLNFYWR